MKNAYLSMAHLGFTPLMVKTYEALNQTGHTTAGLLANHMQTSRSNLYAALSQLEELGFVRKFKANNGPTYFSAVAAEDGLDVYMALKKQQILEVIRLQRSRRRVL